MKSSSITNIRDLPLKRFNEQNVSILKRYILGNSRWEYVKEKGFEYAIRKDIDHLDILQNIDTSQVKFSRTIISFSQNKKLEQEDGAIIVDTKKSKILKSTYTDKFNNQKVQTSHIIITAELFNLEIQEVSLLHNRVYTQRTINELTDELNQVLIDSAYIVEHGVLRQRNFYPILFDSSFFLINPTEASGIYKLEGAFPINEPGIIYAKAYEINSGTPLSRDWLFARSKRDMGWSAYGDSYFYYFSEIRVREYAEKGPYKAIIELWFRNKRGKEFILSRQVKSINGWNRKGSIKR